MAKIFLLSCTEGCFGSEQQQENCSFDVWSLLQLNGIFLPFYMSLLVPQEQQQQHHLTRGGQECHNNTTSNKRWSGMPNQEYSQNNAPTDNFSKVIISLPHKEINQSLDWCHVMSFLDILTYTKQNLSEEIGKKWGIPKRMFQKWEHANNKHICTAFY